MLIELWPVSGQVMAPVIGEKHVAAAESERDDVIRFLEQAGPVGSFRILPREEFMSNRYAGFAIASVGGAHAAKTRLIQDFLESGMPDHPQWLALLNVRYFVTREAVDSIPGLRRAHLSAAGAVFEMPAWLPRATVVGEYRVVAPARAILDSVAAEGHDPSRVTLLERDPGVALGPVAGATATITRYRLNDLTVEVDTPGPAILRLADLWYPDWKATVDGRPAEILKADYLLRGVVVPAGRHRVEFRFVSDALRNGLLLSGASLLVILGLLGAGILRRRAPPSPARGA